MAEIEVTVETIFSSSCEPNGRFRIRVSPDASIGTLLRQLCKEANTPYKVDYCIHSKEKNALSRTDILSDIGITDGAYLIWTCEEFDRKKCTGHCNIFWFIAFLSFMLGTATLVTICITEYSEKHPVTDYAVVFDAGSSHTAMFIYKWESSKFNGTAIAEQFGKRCSSSGGAISNYASDPFSAGKSLQSCLKHAKSKIPDNKRSDTPIYLGATAGMRLLREKQPIASEAIMESIRATFKSSGFKFTNAKRDVRILEGEEEGTFSWITSNYVTNSFKVLKYLPSNDGVTKPLVSVPSVGAMDLGGASTQISFIPANASDIPGNFSKTTELFHHNYTIYTHSYNCYGVNEIQLRTLAALIKEKDMNDDILHPCLPGGYNLTKTHDAIFGSPCVTGKSGMKSFGSIIEPPAEDTVDKNYTFMGESSPKECSDLLTTSLFNFTAPCPYSRCSFNGVYQPPINGLFYAFSSFSYNMNFLNMTAANKDFFPYDEFLYALNRLCIMNWDEVKKLPGDEKFLPLYCQESNYIHVLLTQGYGFTDKTWQNIHFVSKIFNTEIGWTLGFVLDKSNDYPIHKPETFMVKLTFYMLMSLGILFLLVAVGFIFHAVKAGKRDTVSYHSLESYGAI